MKTYSEYIRFKKLFYEYRYSFSDGFPNDHINEWKLLDEKILVSYRSYIDKRSYIDGLSISYLYSCIKVFIQKQLDALHNKEFEVIAQQSEISEPSEDDQGWRDHQLEESALYVKEALKRYQRIIEASELGWKIDEETYTILTEPETLIDEYFHSQVAKSETDSIENELSLALDSLKQNNATACFTHTRKFTEALRKKLTKTKKVDAFKVPFGNSHFYTLNEKMFECLSDAVHHTQFTWTIDEAKFLLRMAITLHTYYEKIDTHL